MNRPIIKIIVCILILAFYGSLLVHKIELPAADDLPRFLKSGELLLRGRTQILHTNVYSYTEPTHPFTNHHWAFGVIAYLIHHLAGWDGLVVAKTVIALSAFSVLFFAACQNAHFWTVAALSLPTIVMLQERTDFRPELFSCLFIALFWYFLRDFVKHPDKNRIFWLIPLQLCWVNIHIFFVIGPAMVAGLLFETIILRRKHARKLAVLFVLLVLTCLINPNGLTGALYPFSAIKNSGITLSENQSPLHFLRIDPPKDNISVYGFFFAVILLTISLFFTLPTKPIFYGLAAATTIGATWYIYRVLPLFCYIFLPVASANIDRIAIKLTPKRGKNIGIFLVFILVGYCIFLGSTGAFSDYKKPGIGLTPQSERSALFLKEHRIHGPIFNNFNIGSYLIYYLYPQEKVFIDNRSEAYSPSFLMNVYLPIFQNEKVWQKTMDTYRFNVIFLHQYDNSPGADAFMYRRIHDPLWRLIYADSYVLILVRNIPENTILINQQGINAENAENKLQFLAQSPRFDEQVAASDIFMMLDRTDLAHKTLVRVLKQWPNKGKIWLVLGEWEESQNNHQTAIQDLEKAIAVGYKTTETYTMLGLAYTKIGMHEKAFTALNTAIGINPENIDAKNLLNTIELRTEQ